MKKVGRVSKQVLGALCRDAQTTQSGDLCRGSQFTVRHFTYASLSHVRFERQWGLRPRSADFFFFMLAEIFALAVLSRTKTFIWNQSTRSRESEIQSDLRCIFTVSPLHGIGGLLSFSVCGARSQMPSTNALVSDIAQPSEDQSADLARSYVHMQRQIQRNPTSACALICSLSFLLTSGVISLRVPSASP